ncbi:MAG: DUF3179 domain-containing (seleno)protein [Chloroflexi bacterium]|nr:DUF3179 domain-containing (seleno)protein [Chloroflexota bacterium]
MAQHNTSGSRLVALRQIWDETLDPRRRAFVGFGVLTVLVAAVFSTGGGVTASGVSISAYIAAVTTLMLARRGYFADRATVFLDRNGERVETRQKVRPVLKRDRVQPLYDPAWMTAEEALSFYPPSARVLGVVHKGEARAFPLAVLSYRESVRDTVGGAPLVVMWAPFCYTGRAFLLPAGNASLRFGSTGRVIINSPVVYDLDTGTEWLQYQGAALDGPDLGSTMAEIPSLNTTLAAWVAAFPETTVINDRVAPTGDLFDNYYAGSRAGMHRAPHRDPRWPAKEIVAGVEIDGDACAFPISWLQIEPIMHEEVGGLPLVVAYEEHSASVVAFRADIGGRRLTFEREGEAEQSEPPVEPDGEFDDSYDDSASEWQGPEYRPMMLRDLETGSRWHAINGVCVGGELAGEGLEPVVAGLTFWFAWTNFHPSARLPPRPDLSGLAPAVDDAG